MEDVSTAERRGRRLGAGTLILIAAVLAMLLTSAGGSIGARHPAARPGARLARARSRAGPLSAAARELAAENAAIDRTLAYTPYVRIAGAQHREIALTFDDGPGPYTPQILAILERYRAPATFFEIGVLERYFHASTASIVARGYPLGDHTQAHAPMSKLPRALQRAQILEQAGVIARYGAPFPRLFRPPYGLWNAATLALLRQFRMLMVLWTVDTSDYRRPGVQAIVRAAIAGARPGAIILLHDAGGNRAQTVSALPKIIAGLRRRGYALVTVPRLLLDNPAPRDEQVSSVTRGAG